MAFNPLHTFQKNRRFWMFAILFICMVSFVFCTGMKGDMAERISHMFSRGGTSIGTVGGRTVTTQQLYELKAQRNAANDFMRQCNYMALKRVNKFYYELSRKEDDKNIQARQQQLAQLKEIRATLYERSRHQRYFDLGVKFDDLLEFKLWQAVADKLDIQLDSEHAMTLLWFEFFSGGQQDSILSRSDFANAQMEVRRNNHLVDDKYLNRALMEEFRVRIAQEAVMKAQPLQFYSAHRQREGGGFTLKFTDPDLAPDQIRAPLTLAQLWDAYKTQRAEFNVTLVPVHVDDFVAQVKDEPTDLAKEEYFKQHKDKTADPNAEDPGLQLSPRVKIEYVIADPTSKEYLGVVRAMAALKTISPVHPEAIQSPLAAAVSVMASDQVHRAEIERQYEALVPQTKFDFSSGPYSVKDVASPIMTWLARRHPEAAAAMVAQGFSGPANDLGALAGYMAWGALKHPQALEASLKAEAARRTPLYAPIVADAAADPMMALGSLFALDLDYARVQEGPKPPRSQQRSLIFFDNQFSQQYQYFPGYLPVPALEHEIEEVLATKAAEEWAQQNMQTLRVALDKASGDSDKYRSVLDKMVPKLNLTYGPANKSAYLNRFNVDTAKEVEPLREAYLKYMDRINFYEGRDVTPERLLKAADFYKMFLESSEGFAATSKFHAMPWPPKARISDQRVQKPDADPRLIDHKNLTGRDFNDFEMQLKQLDPTRAAAEFDMFKFAEKPILFWRTDERIPFRPENYAAIEPSLKKFKAEWTQSEGEAKGFEEQVAKLKKTQAALKEKLAELTKSKASANQVQEVSKELNGVSSQLVKAHSGAASLRKSQTDLKEKEADLTEIKRLIVEGWKFERARSEKALPKAEAIANELLTSLEKTQFQVANEAAQELKRTLVTVPNLAPMAEDRLPDFTLDYFKPHLPKGLIPNAREDMAEQLVRLWNMKEPVKTDNKAIDDINKVLFDKASAKKNPEYVQIVPNKSRSVYYVAFVSTAPRADLLRFAVTMRRIDSRLVTRHPGRDYFAARIQEQQARAYRADVVAYLHDMMGFSIEKADAAKEFDERSTD